MRFNQAILRAGIETRYVIFGSLSRSLSRSLSAPVSVSGSRSLSWDKSFSKSRFRSVSVAHSRFGFKRHSWSRYASLDIPEEAT